MHGAFFMAHTAVGNYGDFDGGSSPKFNSSHAVSDTSEHEKHADIFKSKIP